MSTTSPAPASSAPASAPTAGSSGLSTSAVDNPNGLGLFRLVTTVITLIVGGGVFTLAGDQAAGGASGAAILTAWSISGVGVLCLVMTFYALSRVKPDMRGGIYSYASAGFGDFLGFTSAWGYWISALLCTVSFSALLFGALAYFFPVFGHGTDLPSVIAASALIWFYAWLVSRGITEVSAINAIITVSKIVPIFVAIIAIIFAQKFDPAIFWANLHTGADPSLTFSDQVKSAMMVTIWVFVGIEGAVAISGRAKRSHDVGRATIIAFVCVLSIYLMVSVLSMGVMPLSELAGLENPALAGVMEHAVGPWGAFLINFGVALSLIGAMLGYTVLASESPYEAAEGGVFIKQFAKVNKNGAPVVTLVVTNLIIEAFLISMLFSDESYQFFYTLSAGMILLPYLLSAAYFAKLTFTEKGLFAKYLNAPLWVWRVMGIVGVVYSFFLAYASGAVGLTLMSLLYLPGIPVYIWGKRQRGERFLESWVDKAVVALIVVASAVSLYLLVTGAVAL
ncbi:MAG: amino acid permease [Eggerthellaceae bacterium]|nr:amino acid permease [Eggerthellaceae bacterium]